MVDFLKKIRNSDKFRSASLTFISTGLYCSYPPGSTEYFLFWDEEKRRCLDGYTADDGDYITGYNYFYLNYCPIDRIVYEDTVDRFGNTKKVRRKKLFFPDFYDYDYYFYLAVLDAEDEGKHMCVLKSRRKGYSFKCGSMCCRNYYFIPNSKSYVYVSNKQYLTEDGILNKAWAYLDFIDKHTAWGKKRLVFDQMMHKRASFLVSDEFGNKIETGYKSEIIGVSLKDNPGSVRGKAGKLILFEEAGSFTELAAAWQVARPSVEQDGIAYGLMLAFGCVCAGTRVWTADGNCVNVEDLKQEDGIMGWDTYQAFPQNISNMNPPAEKECVKITTSSGRTLECSKDHPLLWSTPGKTRRVPGKRAENAHMKSWLWHEAGLCKVGEQVGIIDEIPIFGKKLMWEPRLIGWLIGDGSYGKDKTPRLSNCDGAINEYIYSKFNCATEREYLTKDGKTYKETRIKGICPKLRELGIYGQTKDAKRLPNNIHTYDRESLSELIGGLYDTDGYIRVDKDKRVRIILTQAYREILDQVQEVLLHFGVHSSVRRINTKPRTHISNGRTINDKNGEWRLEINDMTSVAKFAENITLTVGYKQSALDFIWTFTLAHLAKHRNYVCGIHADRIVKIEDIGVKLIYNLTAKEQHNYIANGIVTHNTGGDEGSAFTSLKDMFYNPKGYNCLEFENIWDEAVEPGSKCGFFIPQFTNLDVRDADNNRLYMDDDGNTMHKKAMDYVLELRREVIENATSQLAVDRYVAEQPITPREACLEFTGNIFPKKDLLNHLAFIRTHKNLQAHKLVGELTFDNNGDVHWEIKKHGDITKYPLGKNDDPTGAIVIWEHPVKDAPHGLYIAGCLTPGEQVLTDSGYKSVENVTFSDKLVSKDGQYVSIKNLQRYDKINEPIYKVRVSHNYSATTFTQEHPLYVAKHCTNGYNLIDERKFKFDFAKVKDVKVGDWIKYPNVYIAENTFDVTTLWNTSNYRRDHIIPCPFGNKEFWWFVGLWLGDGWCCGKYTTTVVFNSKETAYIDRFRELLRIFNRSFLERLKAGNAIEISINCLQLVDFMNTYFGKYADGKRIPEWVKRLNPEYKKALIQGYLDSDGCVYNCGKYTVTGFVSINLRLLEDIQDILFSLGLISNLCKLRGKQTRVFGKYTCDTKPCYQLRMAYHDSVKLKTFYTNYDPKLDKVIIRNDIRRRSKDGCFLSDDGQYIYFKIREIEEATYTGIVYNFECDTHTFLCRHITTHNCDSYDYDQSGTNSLGSCIIYKRFLNFEEYYDLPVAEYTGRPATAEIFYENVRKLLLYYNATAMYENQNKGLFTYMTQKHCDYLLADQPDILADIVGNSTVQRKKGCHMNKQIKAWGEGKIKDWLNEEYAPGKKNLTKILSEPLLEELISYNGEINTDRVMAFMQIIIYREQLFNVVVKLREEANKSRLLFDGPIFTNEWFADSSQNDDNIPVFTF